MSEDGDATSQVAELDAADDTPEVAMPPGDPGQAFVVGVDRDAVLRRREVVRTVERRGAWVTAILGGIGIIAAVYALFAFRGSGMWPFALLLIAAMLPLVISTLLVYRVQADRQHWYDANELPPVAMRISGKGLELACDGAAFPVVLPWATVRGFTQHKLLGQYMLDLALERGVGATTAGVRGLDQPSVRSVVKPNPLLRPTGMFLIKALDQPVHVIDEAIRHFSNGTAGVQR
ncbi:hypothetical protein ACFV9C_07495 [Kribbella sp. NPDC059898]|uniref:hypothetical protein n=1 Tax=Kribbella sp. NPDC059898 TaxID=3346995 RepID=UPI00365B91D4